jgi:hypothetical protein
LNEEKEFKATGQDAQAVETSRGRMRRKKKKGETAVQPQIHPKAIIAKCVYLARLISRNLI